jgi:Flp pilus assembly protein TadB
MAVYIAAAYRLSPLDPVTSLIEKNIENDVSDTFCKSDVQTMKVERARNELIEEHNKQIREKADSYKHPDKYTLDDISEYVKHNKKDIISKTKKHALRGALKSPLVLLTILAIVFIIVFTVIVWVKNYKSSIKWTMLFICWILVYITGFTIIQMVRLTKNIETILNHRIDKIDNNILKDIKKKCSDKVI